METETPTPKPSFVTLAQLKRQCNVDYDDDNETLLAMGAAAEDMVIRMTNRPVAELVEAGDGYLPASLAQAVLILAGGFYAKREPDAELAAVEWLIRPWQAI